MNARRNTECMSLRIARPPRGSVARRMLQRGLTLIEVLVALLIMSILATLAWQGLDGILRARDSNRRAIDDTVRLTTVMTQWEQDLQAVFDPGASVPPLAFDGQSLRLTRRGENGMLLVVWAVREGRWQRWVSPAMVRSAELQELFARSQAFQGEEAGQLTVATGVTQWQVYFNWGGQWSNAQSTGNQEAAASATPVAASGAASGADSAASAPPPASRAALPEAVRVQIIWGERTLTRDIAVGGG